jgi:hypothetical protein
MTGADDDFGFGRNLLDVIDHVPATHAGHAQIDDGRIEGLFFKGFQRGLSVFANHDIVSHPWELDFHDFANGRFIIDKQHPQTIRRGSTQLATSWPNPVASCPRMATGQLRRESKFCNGLISGSQICGNPGLASFAGRL